MTTDTRPLRLAGPCSACGDGDTAQRYHNHAPPPTKTAIIIELGRLRDLMAEFAVEQEPDADARVGLDWTFELFLQWLRRKGKNERETYR